MKSPLQNAFQYTLIISVLYVVYKLIDINSPKGAEFISYIIPTLLTNIVIVVFPLLFLFFYLKDGKALSEIKHNILDKSDPQITELNNQEMLREYHSMLKEGIITQDEYDSIKKKYLKGLHKD